ncbi:MAG TPA: hypothetical protein VMR74_05120 [Gammaproteobacteria bacterium]|nr:hypothetical protein [Gammaproteobacteria bacterium]
MKQEQQRDELVRAIDAIEGGYEFLLAYAAQGRHTDRDAAGSHGPRAKLEAMAEALAVLPGLARDLVAASAESNRDFDAFLDALARDSAVSRAAIGLVLSRRDISSQIVDNLNASIHLRALLTDVFLIDEALKP